MTRAPARRLRSALRSPWVVGALLAGLLRCLDWGPVDRLDLAVFDLLVPSLRPAALDDVVVVAIDDASIAELGAWPWSRDRHAAMVDRLREAGAAAVGYDVLFAESSTDDAGADAAFATALARNGRVVLPVAPTSTIDGIAALEPLAAFGAAAHSRGHVDVEIDGDGVTRRVYLKAGVGVAHLPAFSVAVEAVRDGTKEDAGNHAGEAGGAAAVGETWVRQDEILLPHASAPLRSVSFARVLRDPGTAATLAGKSVFVGVTATGIGARLTTAIVDARIPMPAVDFLAWVDVVLRSGTAVAPLGFAAALTLSLALLALLAVGAPEFSRSRSLAAGAAMVLPLAISIALLQLAGVWFAPMAATAGLVAGNLLWRSGRLRDACRELWRTQRLAQATLHAIADGVITVDAQQRIRYANPVAGRLAGSAALRDRSVAELFIAEPAHRPLMGDALVACMEQRRTVRVDTDLVLPGDGDGPRLVRITATPLIDPKGRLEGAVVALHDVTETTAATAQLDHAATHDALTGLANRAFFLSRLREAIVASKRSGESIAVLFIDLDRFKRINDSLGHAFGDQVLKVVAERLRSSGRAVDAVARWGGDEFVVLLHGLPSRDAIAGAARRLIQTVSQTIDLDGMELHCGCSLGISLAPHDASDADSLLAMADLAMYRGRARSPGHFEFYASEMALWTRDRLQLESDLRRALAQGEFELHYQPQVSLVDGRPAGLEALLRWRNAFGDLILPDAFIGIAEESGLILAIGEWVLVEAAEQVARWSAAGLPVLPVAINVSARQCLDNGIVRILRDTLQRTGIDPRLLTLEITETTAMRDVEHVIDLLSRISELGIGIAVDDFGTGYSSLAYLKRFPIDQLKIDQSFVRDITSDHNDAAIVVAILALAHSLGWPVVAEGVETEAQHAFLADHGCDLAQGYLFCRPLLPAELVETLGWRAGRNGPAPLATPDPAGRKAGVAEVPLE